MVAIQTVIRLEGISGREIIDFFLNCDDAQYQEWWPGTHLRFHTVRRRPGNVGSIVFMDEYVGRERLRMKAVVTRADPGALTVRMKLLFPLPFWVHIETRDGGGGTELTHRLEAGFRGRSGMFDAILREHFVKTHAPVMDEHARTEFPKLREMLIRKRAGRVLDAARGPLG